MELYFLRPSEFETLYNCSFYELEDIPVENRQHKVLGILYLAHFVFYEILFFPCLWSIWQHLNQSCYKLMFFMGIVDIFALLVAALEQGIFSITGAVFCTYPTFIYFSGVFGLYCWVIESSTGILLAVNRIIETLSPEVGEMLFGGKRTWLWFIPICIYCACPVIFGHISVFNGIYFAWMLNPHGGYHDELMGNYTNVYYTFHSILVPIGLSSANFTFAIVFVYKYGQISGGSSSAQRGMFLQVIGISFINALGASLYIYMQFFYVNQILIYIATYTWMTVHGLPSVIYLTMNKTIRNDCKKILFKKSRATTTTNPTGTALRITRRSIANTTTTNNYFTTHT